VLTNWISEEPLKCIVLCAGEGSRMNPLAAHKPKVMTEISGKPLIHYVIEYWRRFTKEFIFIVGYKKDMVIDHTKRESIHTEIVEQEERKGIAHAISLVEGLVPDKFIVVLGDCLCNGIFEFSQEMDQGIGVWKTSNKQDILQSYSVEISGKLVNKVVEKPTTVVNDLCGMGFYFFRKKLFQYITQTHPSPLRNEIEITDVIQKMIEAGEPVHPVWFRGDYLNVTFPEDIENAQRVIVNKPEERP
jgi:glucose-1-phosphate thymidylyltransferase